MLWEYLSIIGVASGILGIISFCIPSEEKHYKKKFIICVISILVAGFAYSQKFPQDNNGNSESTKTEVVSVPPATSTTTTPVTAIPIVENEIGNTSVSIENIESDVFSGTLTYKGQENPYYFKASNTGKYGFALDINNVNLNYFFALYDVQEKQLLDISYRSQGKTVELTKDETYIIKISTSSGYSQPIDYSISIGIPRMTERITGNAFSGTLTYKGQENPYYFEASNTGKYGFALDINNVNLNYFFALYDVQEKQLLDISYRSQGKTVELTEGETYRIKIYTSSGYSQPIDYNISIIHP